MIEEDMIEALINNEPFKMSPLILKERGNKYRLASISPATAVAGGQMIVKGLLRLLKLDPNMNYSLLGQTEIPRVIQSAVARSSVEGTTSKKEFLSTDLSAASDYIPHSSARACWKGICRALRDEIPDYYEDFGMKLIGAMLLQNPEVISNQALEGVTSKRGILMGLPLTWTILSLINLWAADRAFMTCAEAQAREVRAGQRMRRIAPVIICGDDMGAYWTPECTERYYKHLANAGLVVNQYKTYRSKTGMIFVEKLFKIANTKREVEEKVSLPHNSILSFLSRAQLKKLTSTVHVKKIVSIPRPTLSAVVLAKKDIREVKKADDTPDWVVLPGVLRNEYEKITEPWRREALMCAAKSIHVKAFRIYKNSGLPLYWPKQLGGWGLPGKPRADTSFRRAAAVILTSESGVEVQRQLVTSQLTSNLSPFLKKKIKLVLSQIQEQTESYKKSKMYLEAKSCAGQKEVEEFESFEEVSSRAVMKVTTYHSLDPRLSKIPQKTNYSVRSTVSAIKKIIKETAQKWKSVKPISPDKAVFLLNNYTSPKDTLSSCLEQILRDNEVFLADLRDSLNKMDVAYRNGIYKFESSERSSPAHKPEIGISSTNNVVRNPSKIYF
jgi:hypothetical protein